MARHNHDAVGIYPNCPACGTATNFQQGDTVFLIEQEEPLKGTFIKYCSNGWEIQVSHEYDEGGFDFWPKDYVTKEDPDKMVFVMDYRMWQRMVSLIGPGTQIETDNDGQLIVYTGLKRDGSQVIPIKEEKQ